MEHLHLLLKSHLCDDFVDLLVIDSKSVLRGHTCAADSQNQQGCRIQILFHVDVVSNYI